MDVKTVRAQLAEARDALARLDEEREVWLGVMHGLA